MKSLRVTVSDEDGIVLERYEIRDVKELEDLNEEEEEEDEKWDDPSVIYLSTENPQVGSFSSLKRDLESRLRQEQEREDSKKKGEQQ